MSWVVGLVWGIAVLIAVAVLGCGALDLRWKSRRLARDAAGLLALRDELNAVQQRLADTSRRLTRLQGGD